ncbi:hypothetical protein V5O48_007623 [Marasmius crinis-equi]|uniref:Uncharacterized protein n=1 Tax=Marasmius crinis-equi TaxID=585013 RepID=A0ABR3FG75_9AGAR
MRMTNSKNKPAPAIDYRSIYVVHYSFEDADFATALDEFRVLVQDIEAVGLHTEVRSGYDKTLLVFVKAPGELLRSTVYKSRVKDWLFGITTDQPVKGPGGFEAEDILSVYHLVNWPKTLGGAGITPKHGKWKNVQSIFPLHNEQANQDLLVHMSKRLFLKAEDLDKKACVLNRPEKIAFYFAFTQTYLVALIFPSVTGILAWYFLPTYSIVYAIITSLWCIVFLEYWKLQELDLSVRWHVNGVGSLKINRPNFTYEKEIVDPDTGRVVHLFPKWKRLARQSLTVPFAAAAALVLGALIALVFAVEVFISEVYEGPFKWYLEYLPTILLAVVLPFINNFLEDIATTLTEYENYRTSDQHEMALTQKIFLLNFITTYLPIFLTAFVYVPFGDALMPHIESVLRYFAGNDAKFLGAGFSSDQNRLRNEVIALTVTGQISNFAEELVLPYIKQKANRWWRTYRSEHPSILSASKFQPSSSSDDPSESHFLKSARNQAQLPAYNVQDDISEMIIQFGYLALFSPVWPLIPVGFLINNWIELRSDFLKICIEHQRPAPVRLDGIGPWIGSLGFLNWLGSLSTAAVVHLFGGGGEAEGKAKWLSLSTTIFISEHLYLVFRYIVAYALRKMGGVHQVHVRMEKDERYARRRRQMEELEKATEAQRPRNLGVAERERRKSVRVNSEDLFWTRQVEDGASERVGIRLIEALHRDMMGRSKGE